MLAREIMNKNVITIPEGASIEEAALILTENNISGHGSKPKRAAGRYGN